MEINEISEIYNNKYYDAEDLRSIAYRLMKDGGANEEERVLQTCLKEGLYDSICNENEIIGIKINLKKTPIHTE